MLELVILGATLSVAAWIAGAGAARRTGAARALDRYAASRGLVFVPPASSRASPRVIGSKDGIPFAFDLYRLNGEPRTRVSTDSPRGRAAVVSVGQRDGFHWQSEPVLEIGDERFDSAYLVLSGTSEDGEVLRDVKEPLLLLQDRRSGVWLRSDGHKVTISWRGLESDPIVLDAAREALLRLASHHRAGTAYR